MESYRLSNLCHLTRPGISPDFAICRHPEIWPKSTLTPVTNKWPLHEVAFRYVVPLDAPLFTPRYLRSVVYALLSAPVCNQQTVQEADDQQENHRAKKAEDDEHQARGGRPVDRANEIGSGRTDCAEHGYDQHQAAERHVDRAAALRCLASPPIGRGRRVGQAANLRVGRSAPFRGIRGTGGPAETHDGSCG